MTEEPFWRTKSLEEMTTTEWESLCDRCAKCCLMKLEDEETGEIGHTNVACRLLNTQTCQCKKYPQRFRYVPDCVQMTPAKASRPWLPETCAYRRVFEGRDLPDWHPLKTGDYKTVHQAGASCAGKVISERKAGDLEDHVLYWQHPDEMPK